MACTVYLEDKERKLFYEIREDNAPTCQSQVVRGTLRFMEIPTKEQSGNCAYDAIARCLTVAGMGDYNYKIVKLHAVTYLMNHADMYNDERVDKAKYETPMEYFTAMNTEGEPIDDVCMTAISQNYEVNIYVLYARGIQHDRHFPTQPKDDWPTIYIQCDSEYHYEAMAPIDEMLNDPYKVTEQVRSETKQHLLSQYKSGPSEKLQQELEAQKIAKTIEGKLHAMFTKYSQYFRMYVYWVCVPCQEFIKEYYCVCYQGRQYREGTNVPLYGNFLVTPEGDMHAKCLCTIAHC